MAQLKLVNKYFYWFRPNLEVEIPQNLAFYFYEISNDLETIKIFIKFSM